MGTASTIDFCQQKDIHDIVNILNRMDPGFVQALLDELEKARDRQNLIESARRRTRA